MFLFQISNNILIFLSTVQSQSRNSYWDYVEDLLTPMIKNLKKIYTFIKHKKTDPTGVKNTEEIWIHEQKADLLNNHFYSVFSQQIPMKLSALCSLQILYKLLPKPRNTRNPGTRKGRPETPTCSQHL